MGYRTYNWDRCPSGSSKCGYLAGKIFDLICHVHDEEQTKPCERLLLSPTAACDGCAKGWATAWVGYVPLRDEKGMPVCIVIRDQVADVAGRIEPGARVRWGRDREDKAPVYLVEDTTQRGREWDHWWPKTPPADDMVPWLCRFLSRPHLLEALYRHFSDNAVSQKPARESVPHAELPGWVQNLQDGAAKDHGIEDWETLANRVKDKVRGVGSNGKKNGKH